MSQTSGWVASWVFVRISVSASGAVVMSGIQRLSHAFAAGVSVDSAAILGRIRRKIVDISVIRTINASMRPIVEFIMVCG